MSARRLTRGSDSFGVDVIFSGVCPQPADGALDVLELSGEGVLRLAVLVGVCEPVFDSHCDITTLSGLTNLVSIAVSRAALPSAAMNVNETWEQSRRMFRPRQIELEVFRSASAVSDSFRDDDIRRGLGGR